MNRNSGDDDEPLAGEEVEEPSGLPGEDAAAEGPEIEDFLPGDLEGGLEEEGASAASAGPQILVVDAGAVIEGAEPLRALYKSDPSEAASRLLNLLSWAMGEREAQILVVLERSIRRRLGEAAAVNVAVHRPEPNQTVDAAIRALLDGLVSRGLAERSTVVTSDLEMVRYAAEIGVRSNLGDLFAASLLAGGQVEGEDDFVKPEGLSEKESREWDEFVAKWKAGRDRDEG